MPTNQKNILFKTKLHFRVFWPPIFFLLCLLFAYLFLVSAINEKTYSYSHSYTVFSTWTFLFLSSPFIFGILKLRRIKWTIFKDRVLIQRSDLFGKRFYTLNPEQIYEVTYNQNGLFPKMFNYGSVDIQKTDGNGSYESQDFLINPLMTIRAINKVVEDYKLSVNTDPVSNNISVVSTVDELEKLINLKNKGQISETEYLELKQKLFK
jgi:hypothetical protein